MISTNSNAVIRRPDVRPSSMLPLMSSEAAVDANLHVGRTVSKIAGRIGPNLMQENIPMDGGSLYPRVKRAMDVVGSTTLLVAGAPLLALISISVRATSTGPVIFRQRRITDGGRHFIMYKFRTMIVDAEARTGAIWAAEDDPRVTPIGRFLRHFRLDELPQLFNVLKGEMSLIGPRPERPEMVEMLKKRLPSFERRHRVRAGITGLAQTASGYASCMDTYRRKLALDLLYVKNRCLLLDLRIALRTVVVVLTGSGAK